MNPGSKFRRAPLGSYMENTLEPILFVRDDKK